MPNPQLKSYSDRYNVPLKKVEEFWDTAKEQYGEDWEAVSGTVKKMCQNYKKGQNNMNEAKFTIVRTKPNGEKDNFAGGFSSKEEAEKELKSLLKHPLATKHKQKFEIIEEGKETKIKESNIDKTLNILREGIKVPTYSKAKIKQMIKDGKCEVNTGDIETVRPGSHIELRMFPSKKVKTVQVESI